MLSIEKVAHHSLARMLRVRWFVAKPRARTMEAAQGKDGVLQIYHAY
jgi:hypothetical protein